MKRVLAQSTVTVLLLFALVTGASAAPARNGAPLDDPTLTPDVQSSLREQTALKDAAFGIRAGAGIGILSLNKYGLQTRPVSNYKQERSYWCGPASVRQSLSFHRTDSGSGTSLPSQTTLANKIGTTTSGSLTTSIVSALNSYDGVFGNVSYLASDITDTSNPYESFVNRIGTMLRSITINATAPIILAQTKYIPRYNGASLRHYMTMSGINDNVSPMQMRSVDPNYNSAYYGVRWENVGSTSANGLCKACYEADRAGTNKAMAW